MNQRKRLFNPTLAGSRGKWPGTIPWQEGFVVLQGPGKGQFFKDVPEIAIGLKPIGLGRLDQAVEQGAGPGSLGGP